MPAVVMKRSQERQQLREQRAAELRKWLTENGHTYESFGTQIGVSARRVKDWAAARRAIPDVLDKLVFGRNDPA